MRGAAVALLIGGVALAGLSACAVRRSPPPAAAPADGLGWSLLHAQGEGEKLVLGRPDSDDAVLMLACGGRAGEVEIVASAPSAGGGSGFELSSGGVSRRYVAQAGAPDVSDRGELAATTRVDDPVLTRFAATGRLAISVDGRTLELPPESAGRAGRLLAACRG